MYEVLQIVQKCVLLFTLLFCAWIDWKKQQVYVAVPLLAGITGLALHIFLQDKTIWDVILGMSAGGICLIAALFTKESVGYGDGIIFIFTGVFLGFWNNICLLYTSLVLTGGFALFFIITGKKGRKDRMPVVPFIFTAYVLQLL